MSKLGQFFSPDERDDHVTRCLRPGQVLYLDYRFAGPPEPKYFVLAAFAESRKPLLLKINTRIRSYVQDRPHLLACQVRLSIAVHEFMDHDRFIDCGRVLSDLSYQELRSQLVGDLSRVKGELTAQVKAEIVQVVGAAKTIIPYHKCLIIQALQA